MSEMVHASSPSTLVRVNLVAAVAFVLGGSLFAAGAVLAQRGVVSTTTVNITYLVGGFFFSLGGFLSIVLVVNLVGSTGGATGPGRLKWWGSLPKDLGWRSAVVLFAGTLFFAVSLVAAFAQGLTPRQFNVWVWFPDMTGCVCFLVSGRLAMVNLCGHFAVRARDIGWWVVAVNQLGSVLFFLAGLAAFVRPATSDAINIGLVNWGTFAGAVCFAVAGLVQIFDKPASA